MTREQYIAETYTALCVSAYGGSWAGQGETPQVDGKAFDHACKMADLLEERGVAPWKN